MSDVERGQKLALAVFATLAAIATLTCVGTAVFIPAEEDYTRVAPADLSHQAAGSRVRFQATVDPRAGGVIGSELSGGVALGIVEDERVALYCASNCKQQEAFLEALEQGDAYAGGAREYFGTVEGHAIRGDGVDELHRRTFAEEQLMVEPREAVFVQVGDSYPEARVAVLAIAIYGFMTLLFFLTVLSFHGLLISRTVADARASDRKQRSPWVVLTLAVFTIGLYNLYWRYRTTAALRRIVREPALLPVVDVGAVILSMGVWSWYADARNGGILDRQRLQTDGYQQTTIILNVVGGVLSSCLSCYGLPFATIALLQSGYNELFMRRAPGVDEARAIFGDTLPPASPERL